MTAPVVTTRLGRARGREVNGVAAFKGLPYAAAPQGKLRFQPPAPAPAWDGIRDCGQFGCASPQLAPAPGTPPAWRPGDGLDCLTLNVWSPDLGAAGLPVMVWIHGGLWKHGAARMPQYDAATLARSGVVAVTVNYRVGFEGFGHLPGVPDNRGLRDQIAALEWVQSHIAAFGGDPGNVTVFGQSAGAASATLLLAAPAATGLFRRAIAQSIPAGHQTRGEAAAVTATIALAAGVPATWDAFAVLPPEAILAVQDAPLRGRDAGSTAFSPVVDGDLVTGPTWAALATGVSRDVDLICGYTHEEYRGMGPPPPPGVDLDAVAHAIGLPRQAADAYRRAQPSAADAELFTTMLSDALVRIPTIRTAEAHAAAGGRTWLYDLAWPGPGLGAGHGLDIPLVFGIATTGYGTRFLGTPPPADFASLSEQMRRAWTGFAAAADPGWPRFDLTHHRTRIWDVPPRDAEDPLAGSRRIWQSSPAGAAST
ncbi:carboxylesterase/lipase family protein [Couchioplanes azureus]|uniref:carboxylesterase/lipase family protein n=1 Tax=Couchioplanes caeruleus TaxID=56438 RepID=UPI0019A81972|nr:carboxylesterase family protein [Couchioplanes caeruleus]GGQ82976.1 carboxylic ester hydrolase [Couchioplanes caeruleus subsp. azureus]